MRNLICLTGLKRSGKDTCADYIVSKHTTKDRYAKIALADKLKEFIFLTVPMGIDYADFCGDSNYDRDVKTKYNKNNFLIALDNFLVKIEQYLEMNNIESQFDAEKTRDIGRIVIGERFTKRGVVTVSNRDFTIEEVEISPREILQFFGTDISRALDDELWSKITVNEINLIRRIYPHTKIIISDLRMDVEIEYLKKCGFDPFIIHINRSMGNKNVFANHITDYGINKLFIDRFIENNDTLEKLKENIDTILEEDLLW